MLNAMSDSKYFKGYIGNVFRMKFFLIIISLLLNQELTKGDKQLNLNQYTLVKGPIVIEGVKANASGLTYSAKRDSLFVVLDQPQRVVEITFDGSLKRKIDLNKFQDTEGIAWVTEDIFAIAEEGKCNIVLTELEPGDGGVSWKKSKKLTLGIKVNPLNGIEGLAYDPIKKSFFVAREKGSAALFKVLIPPVGSKENPISILMTVAGRGLKDISGLHYNSKKERLLILSHESACVVEADKYGIEKSRLSLIGGQAGLKQTVIKAEGVSLDKRGTLYIVGEPNQLFVFEKKNK